MPLAAETTGWQSSRGGSCRTRQGRQLCEQRAARRHRPFSLRATLCSPSLSPNACTTSWLVLCSLTFPANSVTPAREHPAHNAGGPSGRLCAAGPVRTLWLPPGVPAATDCGKGLLRARPGPGSAVAGRAGSGCLWRVHACLVWVRALFSAGTAITLCCKAGCPGTGLLPHCFGARNMRCKH